MATWTDPKSRWCWLHRLSQGQGLKARVLTYSYNAESWNSPDPETPKTILDQSSNLIALLHTDRSECKAVERPLIFICHGIGGVIVKRALTYSSTSNHRQVRHRRSIYVSTHAILFFGTPHQGFSKLFSAVNPQKLEQWKQFRLDRIIPAFRKGSGTLRDIEDQFAPLVKRFSIQCFWEELKSHFGSTTCFVVDRDSAVLEGPNIERTGLQADHSHLCKFQSPKDSGFRIVLDALRRYGQEAAALVRKRWSEDLILLKREAEAEAEEIKFDALKFDTRRLTGQSAISNELFEIPRRANKLFTGRTDIARIIQRKFFSSTWPVDTDQHKIFVLYGLGGSGKTEVCLKFAEDHKER